MVINLFMIIKFNIKWFASINFNCYNRISISISFSIYYFNTWLIVFIIFIVFISFRSIIFCLHLF